MESTIQRGPKLIDGIAVLHTNWNFFESLSSVHIPLPFVFLPSEVSKSIKGTRILRQFKYMWSAKLFSANSFNVKLIICSNLRNIPYVQVSKNTRAAFEKSLTRLSANFSTCTNKYHDQTNADALKQFCVMQCDFKQFGYLLEQDLAIVTNQEYADPFSADPAQHGCVKAFFLASSFGQNAEFDCIKENLHLDWVNVSEVIVHIAVDFNQSQRVLFWRRKNVTEVFDCHPNYEYSNIGVRGCGNFYFIPPRMEGEVCFSLIKLYSELTKFAKSTFAFKKSEVAKFLAENDGASHHLFHQARRRILQKIKHFEQMCSTVDKCVESTAKYEQTGARLECLVSVFGGTDRWKELSDYFDLMLETNNFQNPDLFISTPVSKITARQKFYVKPAIRTIQAHLEKLKRTLISENEVFDFTFGTQGSYFTTGE